MLTLDRRGMPGDFFPAGCRVV